MRFLAKVLNLECRVRRSPYQRSISSNAWVGNEGEVDAVIFVRAGFQQSNLAAATLCAGQYSCSNIQDRRSHCRPRRIALARVLLTAQRSTHCNEAICREPEARLEGTPAVISSKLHALLDVIGSRMSWTWPTFRGCAEQHDLTVQALILHNFRCCQCAHYRRDCY